MLGLALWILCFLRRRQAIGGWLLVFVIQIVFRELQLAFQIFAMVVAWRARNPGLMIDAERVQRLIALQIATLAGNTWAVAATVALLRTREWRYVVHIRGCLAVTTALAVAVVALYPLPANWFDVLFLAAFLLYFYRSKRVRRVFATHDWDDSPSASLGLTRITG